MVPSARFPRTHWMVALALAGSLLSGGVQGTACAIVHRDHRGGPKQQIAGLEEQWRNAMLKADVAALDQLLSADYVGISVNGEVSTKAMQMDRLRAHTLALTQLNLSEMRVKVVSSIAIVTATAAVTGRSEGLPVDGNYRYTRVYERMPNGSWQITNFELARIKDSSGPVEHVDHHDRHTANLQSSIAR